MATQVSEAVKRATAETHLISSKQNECPAREKCVVPPNLKTARVERTHPKAHLEDRTNTPPALPTVTLQRAEP